MFTKYNKWRPRLSFFCHYHNDFVSGQCHQSYSELSGTQSLTTPSGKAFFHAHGDALCLSRYAHQGALRYTHEYADVTTNFACPHNGGLQ